MIIWQIIKQLTIGQLIMCSGFLLAYITMQVIPMICMVMVGFGKEERKGMSLNDWLFAPFIPLFFLIPFFGAIVGGVIVDGNKWLTRIALISVYMIIVGFIIMVTEIL